MTSEIVISGGGMVGLTAACLLAQQGFHITLIESTSERSLDLPASNDPYDLRVVALNQASQRLLEKCGAWTTIASSRYCAYEHMRVWDSVADGVIHFSAAECLTPHLGYIVEQKVILGALWQKIQSLANIQMITGCQIEALQPQNTAVEMQLSNGKGTLSSGLLIVAEGARSPVRDLMGITLNTKSYEQTAIVATLQSNQSHQQTAYQRFAPLGPLAWLPLGDPHLTSIVWTTSAEEAHRLCGLSETAFNQSVMRESGGTLGQLSLVSERKTFALQRQHALRYGSQRCVLVGDAAHTIHPLAGQGVNCGLRDLSCLSETIIAAKQKSRDIGTDKVIGRYQRHARWYNQAILAAMDVLNQGFAAHHVGFTGLRNAGLNWVDRQPKLKRLLIHAAQGIY